MPGTKWLDLVRATHALPVDWKGRTRVQLPLDGYTEQQRFFLNFGRVWARAFKPEELKLRINTDVHAPAQFRAVAAPSNMPAFAQAFACKPGDAMVRAADVQVKIW